MNDGSPLKISGNKFSEIKFRCHSHQTELCDRKSEEGKDGGAVDLLYIGNLCDPGGMRDRQMFRNQRADLRGIAVGCLTSADNQIRAADHLNTLRRR